MSSSILATVSKPILSEVANTLGFTVGLGKLYLKGTHLMGEVISSAVPDKSFGFNIQTEYKFPIHSSAPGKSLLAALDEIYWDELIERIKFIAFNKNTISSPEKFKETLFETRSCGFGVDFSEEVENCRCVAVSLFENSGKEGIRSLWITGQSKDVKSEQIPDIAIQLKKAAKIIEQRFLKTNQEGDNVLLAVEQLLHLMKHKLDENIDIKAWAQKNKYSYSWFCQIFKKEKGMSPHQYHLWLRLEKSKYMLKNTDMTIKKVSLTLGFLDQNHFSGLFKRKVGVSPKFYREQSIERG